MANPQQPIAPPQQYQPQQQHYPTGKRRALYIGINYIGQQGELRGCHQDVNNIQAFVRSYHKGMLQEVVLMDEVFYLFGKL